MRRILLLGVFCASLGVGGVAGYSCATAPPNITPQAVVAFHGTQVIHALDQVRDTAHAAHGTIPPLISAQTDLKVVTWHESTITVVRAARDGWIADVLTALDRLKNDLSPVEWQVVAPYVALAKTLLTEVSR